MSEGTALLVIDMQVGLVAGAYRAGEVLGTIATLLAKARSSGTTVVYLQHESDEFEPLKRGTATWQIHPEIVPAEGELVIPKRASDSFYQTPLRRELEAKGVRHIVVTGMMTEACVDTTSRAAISLGYDVTLVGDAHTTWNGRLPAAQIIEHHNATLADLVHPDHIIKVRPAEAVNLS